MTNVVTNPANNKNVSPEEKQEIIALISDATARLGSMSAVATLCGVSNATISLMAKNEYETQGSAMWLKVGHALNWRPGGWQIADTQNVRAVMQTLHAALHNSLFVRIAEKAGGGKSTGITAFCNSNSGNIFRIICRSWGPREFMDRLCKSFGIDTTGGGYRSLDNLLELVIAFFAARRGKSLLIIDQANSLKPAVLACLIHLFNEHENRLGVAICGTEHLRKDFENGVKYNRKGYDELDSRFGRSFISLVGNTLADVRKICEANGIPEKDTQQAIFNACNPVTREFQQDGQTVSLKVVLDGRLVKRAIQKYHLLKAI